MDNHPLARRPHKSPAHTVKDLGAGLSAFPFSPRRTEVPEGADYYTANFDSVNTVSSSFSPSPPPFSSSFRTAPGDRAAHLTAPSKFVNRPSKPLLQPRPASVIHLSGARIVHTHNRNWKRVSNIFFRSR